MVCFRPKPECARQLPAAAPAKLAHHGAKRDDGIRLDLLITAPDHAWLLPAAHNWMEVDRLLREFRTHLSVETRVEPSAS
jgi:hypothetical protein